MLLFRLQQPLRALQTGAAGMSRAPAEVWGMSTPAACLLLSRFAPATVQLFAEFRRLRDSLTPAEARKLRDCEEGYLRRADVLTAVRLCARPTSRAHACVSFAVCSASNPAPTPHVCNVQQMCSVVHGSITRRVRHPCLNDVKLCCVRVQTLGNIEVIMSILSEEQRCKVKVQRAKAEGVMYPALVELVCEALAGNGQGARPLLGSHCFGDCTSVHVCACPRLRATPWRLEAQHNLMLKQCMHAVG